MRNNVLSFVLAAVTAINVEATETFQNERPGRWESPEETNVFSHQVCQSNSEGFFGALGPIEYNVRYFYEIQLQSEPPQEDLLETISSLEKSFADRLLETRTFDEACNDGGRRMQRVRDLNENDRRLQAVGLASQPPDAILGLDCTTQAPDSTSHCEVIDGEFIVYAIGIVPGIVGRLRSQLAQAMGRGEFNGVDPNIMSITMVNDPRPMEFEPDPIDSPGPNQVQAGGGGGNNRGAYIGAAVGAVTLLAALLFYRRRQRKNDEEEAEFTTPGGTNV